MADDVMKSGEILLYHNGADKEFVNVVCKDETFWLTQKAIAELSDTSKQNINLPKKLF